jgi:hypothetical protein
MLARFLLPRRKNPILDLQHIALVDVISRERADGIEDRCVDDFRIIVCVAEGYVWLHDVTEDM